MKKLTERLGVLVGRLKIARGVICEGPLELSAAFTMGMVCGSLLAATADEEAKSKLQEVAQKFLEGLKEKHA